MTIKRFIEIVNIMLEYGMIDKSKLHDADYLIERVSLYIRAKAFVDKNFNF